MKYSILNIEIDAACELVDFLRFNVQFLYDALKYKPLDVGQPVNTINNMYMRGLEGFVAAVAPFNFTAISGNLATAPALMGKKILKFFFLILKISVKIYKNQKNVMLSYGSHQTRPFYRHTFSLRY